MAIDTRVPTLVMLEDLLGLPRFVTCHQWTDLRTSEWVVVLHDEKAGRRIRVGFDQNMLAVAANPWPIVQGRINSALRLLIFDACTQHEDCRQSPELGRACREQQLRAYADSPIQ